MIEDYTRKLQSLLRTLFQFDSTDLDFGIYRIMNQKREEVDRFINEELIKAVDGELEKYTKSEKIAQSTYPFQKKEKQKPSLYSFGTENEEVSGSTIIDTSINTSQGSSPSYVAETSVEYHSSHHPRILETKVEMDYTDFDDYEKSFEQHKAEIYSHIYHFFSRYYDNGDFISLQRYSKQQKYAIPYNGEEVLLHWANKDQYFIKTGKNFQNYTFMDEGKTCTVYFRVSNAQLEQNNNKNENRYFFLKNKTEIETEDEIEKLESIYYDPEIKELTILFEYRGLTKEEEKEFGTRNVQDKILDAIETKILASIKNAYVKTILEKPLRIREESNEDKKCFLRKHLNRYVRENKTDYFIHKDLKVFLTRELDFYIKNEIFDLDDILESGNETRMERYVGRVKVFKTICLKIIYFLSQIEEFQKKLFEKKKFVLTSEYCITLENIFEKHYLDILKNKAQIAEWKLLYSFDIDEEIKKLEGKLTAHGMGDEDKKIEVLKQNPTLVIDTKLFGTDFKCQILSEINDNDDKINGILIKSENFQALNLLSNKYQERIKCCYIDPPFNLGENPDYLYKVDYKDSTWLCLLNNPIHLYRDFMTQDGSIFVRCNHDGNMLLRLLLTEIFGVQNYRNEIIVRRAELTKGDLNKQFPTIKSVTVNYDNIYWYSKNQDSRFEKIFKPLTGTKSESHWHSFWKAEDRQNLRYEILGIDLSKHYGQWMWKKERAFEAVTNYEKFLHESKETGEDLDTFWQRTGEKFEFIRRDGDGYGSIKYWIPPRTEIMADNNWLDIKGYANKWGFKTENSEPLLKRIIENLSQPDDFIIDFFGGSGTTAAVAHKLKRKWICVEMGNYFDTFLLPRMKLVLFGETSGISKEVGWKGGGVFKYLSLEQYEDTLNNIEFREKGSIQRKLEGFSDYMLHYMLDFETIGSPCRLNVAKLNDPFSYTLTISEEGELREQVVDLVETFNYLLGIHVKNIKTFENKGTYYRVIYGFKVYGENERKENVIIIWRCTEGLDLKEDKSFIEDTILQKMGSASKVYINSDFVVEGALPIEPTFTRLMGA